MVESDELLDDDFEEPLDFVPEDFEEEEFFFFDDVELAFEPLLFTLNLPVPLENAEPNE